ncbi:hypothetical protein [Ottowia thiooxydans]|uniref:Uncharacterized protein n=1 Tax=Ottowia thiooxydans TaxID=219182 RepID=A0ABV2QEB0_9BURK
MPNSKGLFVFLPSRRIFSSQGLVRVTLLCLFIVAATSVIVVVKAFIEFGDDNNYRLPKDSIAEIGLEGLKEPAFLRLPVGARASSNNESFSR